MSPLDENAPHKTTFDALRPTAKLRINRVCDEYETLWSTHPPADIHLFVQKLNADELPTVIRELVEIDLEHRARLGLPVDLDNYLARFPQLDSEWLQSRWQQIAANLKGQTLKQPSTNASHVLFESKQLGDYKILGTLGSGGMGDVYRAEHTLMGRQVAIKVLRETGSRDPQHKRRFEREVKTIAKLSHPNIVSAFDAREVEGTLYLVTELVDGEDLARLVKRKGPLKACDAMYYTWQAAKGLRYAHEKGIVHRDVKPSNLILEKKKTVKVLDLGLARLLHVDPQTADEHQSITTNSHVVGTAAFMSPEQGRSPLDVNEASDVYSLGCTLFYLLVGKPPFQGRSDVETVLLHVQGPVPDLPPSIEDLVRPQLNHLVRSMLHKEPNKRPSMQEIIARLTDLIKVSKPEVSQSPIQIHQTKRLPRISRRSKRHLVWWSVSSIVGLAAIVGLLAMIPSRENGIQPIPADVAPPPKTAAPIKTDWNSGLSFDGERSYVEIDPHQFRVTDTISMEVALVALPQQQPCNIVSFSGSRCCVLFIANRLWGLAYFHGQRKRLIVSDGYVPYGEAVIVTGQVVKGTPTLWIDGERMSSREIDYPMQSGPNGIFLGGIPDGVIPVEQGTRYFHGRLVAVRIESGELQQPSRHLDELARVGKGTIALFPLSEKQGELCSDASPNRLRGVIRNADWFTSPFEGRRNPFSTRGF